MRSKSYVVLDTETTGLRAGHHALTELYAARINAEGEIQDEFHSLINPEQHIPSFITRLTGITNDMVKDSPKASQVIEDFNNFLRKDDVLVGHNIRFDLNFLNHERTRVFDEPFSQQTMCTLLLARRVFANDPLYSYRLNMLAEYFSINTDGAHRAKQDVLMTIAVLQGLFTLMEEKNKFKCFDDVHTLQYLPLAKACKVFS